MNDFLDKFIWSRKTHLKFGGSYIKETWKWETRIFAYVLSFLLVSLSILLLHLSFPGNHSNFSQLPLGPNADWRSASLQGSLPIPRRLSAPDWDCRDIQHHGLSNYWVLVHSSTSQPLLDYVDHITKVNRINLCVCVHVHVHLCVCVNVYVHVCAHVCGCYECCSLENLDEYNVYPMFLVK